MLIKEKSLNIKACVPGMGGAVGSICGCFFSLKALETLPEAVVFPVALSGPIIIGVLLSLLLFKEKISKCGYLGILSGIVGIATLCIK